MTSGRAVFLWIYQRRRDLRAVDPAVDFDAAARDALTIKLPRRQRREHLRDGGHPLPRREDDDR